MHFRVCRTTFALRIQCRVHFIVLGEEGCLRARVVAEGALVGAEEGVPACVDTSPRPLPHPCHRACVNTLEKNSAPLCPLS